MNIEHFKSMFNLPQEDSLEVNILPKKTSDQILEFTINLPPNKVKDLDQKGVMDKYNIVLEAAIAGLPAIAPPISYFEFSPNGKIHLHGALELTGTYYEEGVIETFCKQALAKIDKRLSYSKYKYYFIYERYKSPSVCAQITESPERRLYWQQYISKDT